MKLLFNDAFKTRIILIDIDGVACDHVSHVIGWVRKTYGINFNNELFNSLEFDFGPVSFPDAFERCLNIDDLVLSWEPYKGFQEFFNTISDSFEIKFITSRKSGQNATKQWVKNHFGNCEVLFKDKNSDPEYDYIVDDNPGTILKSAAQKKISFLPERPWNNNENTINLIKAKKFAYFVKSYKDIISFLWSTNLFQSC